MWLEWVAETSLLVNDQQLGVRGLWWPFIAADSAYIPAINDIRKLNGPSVAGHCPWHCCAAMLL